MLTLIPNERILNDIYLMRNENNYPTADIDRRIMICCCINVLYM